MKCLNLKLLFKPLHQSSCYLLLASFVFLLSPEACFAKGCDASILEDKNGKLPKYYTEPSPPPLYKGKEKDGKWGIVDQAGNWVIPPEYDGTYGYNADVWKKHNLNRNAVIVVKKGKKYGGVNLKNEIIIPLVYDYVYPFRANSKYVTMIFNKKWGVIDLNGKVIIKPIYDRGGHFSDGLISRKKNGKWGYLNDKAEIVIPFKYENGYRFSEGVAAVSLEGKNGATSTKKMSG